MLPQLPTPLNGLGVLIQSLLQCEHRTDAIEAAVTLVAEVSERGVRIVEADVPVRIGCRVGGGEAVGFIDNARTPVEPPL